MKTLRKALDIMELVSYHCGRPVTPSQVAESLNINLSSCVRMMRTLTERGYLMQLSRRVGYVVGPALTTYSCRQTIFNMLVAAAKEPLKELSNEIHALVNLSVLHCDQRYLIYHYGYTPGIWLCEFIAPQWNYQENATERLLLAAAGKTERKRIIDREGVPAGFLSVEQFVAELDRMKQAGYVKFYREKQQLWVVGGLVRAQGVPAVTIGLGTATEPEADRAVEAVGRCGQKICANLNPKISFQ